MRKSNDNTGSASGGAVAFWLTYFITIVLVIFRGMTDVGPFWLMANDDMMRLVEVRDLLNGQGWFDLMQYRLGEGGTLMHWSRLVDVPIAGLIAVLSLITSNANAELVTIILWPILLIGPTLWFVRLAVVRFGGKDSGVFGLIFGAIAIVVSEKFNPGSLDHHNIQMLLVVMSLSALMQFDDHLSGGIIAGVGLALSLTIGLETMPIVAAMSLAIGIIWAWKGLATRFQTVGYAAAFVVTLVAVYLGTSPDFTQTNFRCDTFGFDLMSIGVFGASGLLVLSLISRDLSLITRVGAVIGLGVAVIAFAKLTSPACLQNPLNQLYPAVATEWLGRITEAKSLMASVKSDGAGNFGLLFVPVIASLYAIILGRNPVKRTQSLILICAIMATYALTFYQLRGLFFMLILSAIPISAMIGRLYVRYKTTGSSLAGVLVIGAMLVSVPDLWSLAYINWPTETATSNNTTTVANVGAYDHCILPETLSPLAQIPTGLIASSTDMGAALLLHTPHGVLSSNFHRNQDGIQAGIDLAKADMTQAVEILRNAGVDYVVLCKNDLLPLDLSGDNPNGLWPMLYTGKVPSFLAAIDLGGQGDPLILAYEVLK